ncbi:MalY/PatB family protein [Thalassorhabdomicrobium marinisediminis]|uniref:MalY/PatB family protein n=1 Tax=Thalassorhabdomicrobium marinisediminis TaxID=2170577 RepID=UPI00248F5694|nr:aminotransferase class I/II-fold pyridoxal phosphate-dependent enzyme [Thalassorhabdomicrobium marinisediminis]
MQFDFETPKTTAAGRSSKWHMMDALLGHEPADDMIPMWVAQMDFQPAPFLQQAARAVIEAGEYGYFPYDDFAQRVSWWYQTRHGWTPDPAHVFPTHGIGNAVGLVLQALTEPGDGIIVFSPVYHEFYNKIRRNGRAVVESPLEIDETGVFRMNLSALEAQLSGTERAVMFCSPHNPAGRTWTPEEIQELSAFCARNELLLISDEIHMDLAYPGYTHTPTALNAPDSLPNLIVLSAASKTFDIAGLRTGYAIVPDNDLRARFAAFYDTLDIQPNRFGADLTCAAYSPEGADWVDALMGVLDGNRTALCDGLNEVPGLRAMPMEGTYLGWVDFSGTGMSDAEVRKRLYEDARVLPTPGDGLGTGGALHHRFNIGTPRALVDKAVARIQQAFRDLQ